MLRLQSGSASDVGRVRSNNQDASITTERVLAVADGMGGHRGGEVASQIALEVLPATFTEPSIEGLEDAARVANRAVWNKAAEDPDLRGMGTTLVAIAPIVDDDGHETLAWLNIGDSRLYLLRDGELDQVSEDHSLVEEMVRDGRISAEEARGHPQRNILTRALGIDQEPAIDTGTIDPYEGDRYLLCSDGLFNEVDEQRIASTLRRLADPEQAAQELVRLALEGGGRDNITVVVADVVDDGGVAAAAAAEIEEDTGEGHAEPSLGATSTLSAPDREQPGEPREKRPRPRVLTVRFALFVVVLLAVVGGAAFAVIYQARSGYTVQRVDGQVLIYEGNGDKVLWLDPRVKETIGNISIAPADQQRVDEGQHFGSLDAAREFIENLRRNAASVGPAATTTTTTTTSTTTTTAPTTVPTAPPAVN